MEAKNLEDLWIEFEKSERENGCHFKYIAKLKIIEIKKICRNNAKVGINSGARIKQKEIVTVLKKKYPQSKVNCP